MERHLRRCWDCGVISAHCDNTIPEVNCRVCHSADTRPLRSVPQTEIERLRQMANVLEHQEVLLSIPQPYRMRLSELLHGSDAESEQPQQAIVRQSKDPQSACHGCDLVRLCKFAWDPYNIGSEAEIDCLAAK